MIRREGTTGEFYALHGERSTVFVNPRVGRDSGVPMAVVSSVKPAAGSSAGMVCSSTT